MHSDPSFEPLAAAEGGPSLVVRHDDTVLRPAEPWTPTIHALLRHLEAVGFTGAPRVVGDGYDGHGNEVLTYVEGEVRHPHPWSDDAIWRVGRLLRQLHDATASFQPPADAVWPARPIASTRSRPRPGGMPSSTTTTSASATSCRTRRPERRSCGRSSTATTCPPPSGPASSPT